MMIADQERANAIQKSLDEYKKSGANRTEGFSIRGQRRELEVIRVNLDILLFNHDNNRLAAQLDGHPSQKSINENPKSYESQQVLHQLLAQTPRFSELKNQLKELGQQDPGLVTRQGLLINGNTRLAALVELKKESGLDGMDVAVLPSDLTQRDILNIEAVLQMRDLVHQRYSYTNELLMTDRLQKQGWTKAELIKILGYQKGKAGEKKIDLHMRVLEMIREIRSLIQPPIPWDKFDSDAEAFKNLDEKFQSLLNQGDTRGAESMKWSRIAGMCLGLSKDHVRQIDEHFFQDMIIDKRVSGLSGNSELEQYLDTFKVENMTNDPGGLLDDEGEDETYIDTKGLVKNLLSSEELREDSGAIKKDKSGIPYELRNIMRNAARASINEQNEETERQAPVNILKEVRIKLDEIVVKIPDLAQDPEFRGQDFAYEVKKLKKNADEIARLRKKYMEN